MMRWIGNSQTMIVHESRCEYAESVSPWNMELFDSLHEALSAGYRECGYCLTDKPMMIAYSAPRVRAHRAAQGCLICGTTRAVQMAHVLPRTTGYSITVELCANHHWAYDSGQLTQAELATLKKACKQRHGSKVSRLIDHGHGAVRQSGSEVAA